MDIGTRLPQLISPGILTQDSVHRPGQVSASGGFSAVIGDLLKGVEAEQSQVGQAADRLITGEANNFHEISLAVARADISFRFMMEVRDQLVGAYREVIRMQV